MEVFIDKCEDYRKSQEVIEDAFETLGGINHFIKNGETILLKPNLLKASSPEKGVVTHPEFIISVINALEKKDIKIIVGDSPAGRMNKDKLQKCYRESGWLRIEEETNAKLNYNVESVNKKFQSGKVKKSFKMMKIAEEVDGIINLPKLKTHSFTVYTGAVKNKYGLVHGLTKAAYHGQFNKMNHFGKMLLDVNDSIETRLTIMDGIVGMEGKGPSGGKAVELNCILASEDEVALDYSACELAGIPYQKVPTLVESEQNPEEIDNLNRPPASFDYEIEYPSGGSTPYRIPDFLSNFLSNFYLDRPSLDEETCIKCWECEDICPEDAIKKSRNGPNISWWKCIRCYSCAEACPVEALTPG